MKLNNFIEGLQILQPYYDKPDGYHIGAEHDEFYAYATDKPLTPEHVAKLRELGWFQAEVEDGAPYDPAESWSAYT